MGKYDPLERYLRSSEKEKIELKFEEIKEILGSSLPDSAYIHNPWWANDETHSQGRAWLNAGYEIASVNLRTQKVTFIESGKTRSPKEKMSPKAKGSPKQKKHTNEKVTGGIALVSCTKKKRDQRSKPKELYMASAYFQKMRRYSEKYHDDWYILSVKHHLLDPEGPKIGPYDDTLKDATKEEKIEWGKKVFRQLQEEGLLDKKLYIHAGEDYYQGLLPLLAEEGVKYEIPTKGLRIGKTMSWYNQYI